MAVGGSKKCSPGCRCGRHVSRRRSEETKRRIAEGRARVAREARNSPEKVEPDKKKCRDCKRWKPIDNFYTKKKTLHDGEVVRYPEHVCKKCSKKRQQAWREKKRANGELTAIERGYRKRHEKKIGKTVMRQRRNESRTVERLKKGGRTNGNGKYTDKGSGRRLDKRPIADFVGEILKSRRLTLNQLADKMGSDREFLKRSLDPADSKNLTLKTIDRILLALDREEMLTILYPE